MTHPEHNHPPLNAPSTGATPAAPSDQSVASETSGKVPVVKAEAQLPSQGVAPEPTQGEAPVPAPPVKPPVKQAEHRLKQAAQSEHKPSTDGVPDPTGSKDCAHAGGRSPQPPKPINKLKSAVKRRSKKRDNHVSVRCQDDEMDVIEERMTSTGETQSQAVRAIILEHKNKEGNVYLQPKTPIEQLEELLGLLGDWRIPAFDEIGRPVRQRGTDPRRFLRRAMDQMTDELNVIRDADGSELINTMQMVKKQKAIERGEIDVVEELAKLKNPPKNEKSLIDSLLFLRCTISRYNSEEDTISITPIGKKKAKRFPISKLLEDIGLAVLRLVSKRKTKEKKKHTSKKGESAEQEDNIG